MKSNLTSFLAQIGQRLSIAAICILTLAPSRLARAQSVDYTSAPIPPGPGSGRGLIDAGDVQPVSGAYTYRVPIDLPAYAGLAPTLALTYSSASGNGIVGGG